MSFVPYVPNNDVWKQLPDYQTTKSFYPLQKGKGADLTGVEVISPQESIIQRAKSTLNRNINRGAVGGVVQSASGRKRKRSKSVVKPVFKKRKVVKRKKKTVSKKKKPIKKRKKKQKKKQSKKRVVKKKKRKSVKKKRSFNFCPC